MLVVCWLVCIALAASKHLWVVVSLSIECGVPTASPQVTHDWTGLEDWVSLSILVCTVLLVTVD